MIEFKWEDFQGRPVGDAFFRFLMREMGTYPYDIRVEKKTRNVGLLPVYDVYFKVRLQDYLVAARRAALLRE